MWWRYVIFRVPFAILAKTKKYNLKVNGVENVPEYGPFIVVANHQTSADIVAIALALKPALKHCQMWPWAKVEIREGKEGILGKLLWKIFGVIPIDRESAHSEDAVKPSLKRLQKGEIVCVFPEGTRRKHRQLGHFKYGVANLARAAPAPLLPVAVYKREEDGGIQVNIGKLFFMPPKRKRYETLEAIEEKLDERVSHQIDALKQWSAELPKDKKGMKMIASMINMIADRLSKQEVSFDKFCRMAEEEDNEYIRNKVFELLPEGWKKTEVPKEET